MNIFFSRATRLIFKLVKFVDYVFFVKTCTYQTYEKIHAWLGYPLIKLEFYSGLGYWPNMNKPKSFNEKLLSARILDRSELLPLISDKLAVRGYIEKKVGKKYLVPLHGVYESITAFEGANLPDECVLKMNHSSGQIIFKRAGEDISNEYYRIEKWFSEKYKFQKLMWFSQKIKRQLLVEDLLTDDQGQVPKDYKFFVFGGEVEFIQVDLDRFNRHSRTLYSPDWKVMGVGYAYTRGYEIEQPSLLSEMKSIAEKLASDFDFMRVDLYEVEGKVYFGELTSYPSSGNGRFEPSEYDFELGKKLEERKSACGTV